MTQEMFRHLTPLGEALELCRRSFGQLRTEVEPVPLQSATGRVLASPVQTDVPLPHFARSVMDGYAVRAADTFSASDSAPVLLRLVGSVTIGYQPDFAVNSGEAAAIPTGGMLPPGADAVLMQEFAEPLADGTVQGFRPVAPGRHVQQIGEDLPAGATALPAGTSVAAAHVALLAALGLTQVQVHRRPRIGILSTGDELVPSDTLPAAGRVRDSNAHGLAALSSQCGAEPVLLGIVPDHLAALQEACAQGLESCDMLVMSGGSSLGTRDLTVEVLGRLGEPGVLLNGIALRPGKPTIVACCGGKPAFGLPGHPLSALVVFHRLVRPVAAWLSGTEVRDMRTVARAGQAIASEAGMTQYVPVRLRWQQPYPVAESLLSKSASLSALVHADGLVEIAAGVEGVEADELVDVVLWS